MQGGVQRVAFGRAGAIRDGHRTAAALSRWEIVRVAAGLECRGHATERNEYRLQQRPLDLMVEIGGATWVWKGVEPVVRDDGEVVVSLAGEPATE
jgi:hypothetical protein